MNAPRPGSTSATGTAPKKLSTKAGDIELGIPKLRRGSFLPTILEPRRRIDQALYAVVMEAYVSGVSTRAVDEPVGALGIGTGISRREVSRTCAGLDEAVAVFRDRRLDHTGFPYVYLVVLREAELPRLRPENLDADVKLLVDPRKQLVAEPNRARNRLKALS